MDGNQILLLGIGIEAPWKLVDQRLDTDKQPHELHLEVQACLRPRDRFWDTVFVNKVVRFNQATNASFCASARTSFGGFNQTFSTLFQFLI